YFNQVFVPLSMPLFFLMGLTGLKITRQKPTVAWAEGIISLLFGLWVSLRFPPVNPAWTASARVCLGVASSAWLLLSTLKVLLPFRRHYLPMILAHVGVGLCILGITLNTQYTLERELKMKPNDSLVLANNRVLFAGLNFL